MDKREAVVRRELEALLAGDTPIVAGPWLGEVGFETLYWLPFLKWAVEQYPELSERMVAVSRGGVSGWYERVACRYLDLFDFHDYDEFQERQQARIRAAKESGKSAKQTGGDGWDGECLAWAEGELGGAVRQLSPATVHRHRKLISTLPPPRLTKPPRPDGLPDRYVAVRFYRNRVLRGDGAEELAAGLTTALAEIVPVVSLNTPMQVDPKHPDFRPRGAIDLSPRMTLRDNLAFQSAVLAHAEAFVGTYGGLSYVPPLYGVPSYCFWNSERGIVPAHLDLARRSYGEDFHAALATSAEEALRIARASCVPGTLFKNSVAE